MQCTKQHMKLGPNMQMQPGLPAKLQLIIWMLLCYQIDIILRKTDAFCQLCGWNLLDWSDWDCWPVDSQCPHHKPRQIFVEPENKYLCWGARSFVDKDDKHLSQTYFRSVAGNVRITNRVSTLVAMNGPMKIGSVMLWTFEGSFAGVCFSSYP